MLKKIVAILVSMFVLLLGLAAFGYYFYKPSMSDKEIKVETIVIDQNMTGSEIGALLAKRGLIPSEFAFRLALRLTGTVDDLQKGYYQIPNDTTLHDIISILQKGNVKTVKITIPEGYTVKEIAKLMEENQLMKADEFLSIASTYAPYMYVYGPKLTLYKIEGFLFPSTYQMALNSKPEDVLKQMAEEMNKQLTAEMRKEIERQGMTIYEFLTLASLVEKEAQVEEDRPLIAAVFKKRLAINMPLQSCASIQYLLEDHKMRLSYEDTQIDSPYNTYKYAGLPPGPIANPGLAAMNAVLHAPETENLFFVADKNGKHHFTKTYEEHLAVVESIYGAE